MGSSAETTESTSTETTTETTTSSPLLKPGDVDKNGKVESMDASLLLKHITDISSIVDPVSLTNADCDGKQGIDMNDAIWILNHRAQTETTTEATTSQTAEPQLISSDYSLAPDSLAGNPYFVQTGSFASSTSTRIRLTSENSLTFNVAEGASLYITAAHASSTDTTPRTVFLKDIYGNTISYISYEQGISASEQLYATNLKGTYTISADNHINVTDIRIVFG